MADGRRFTPESPSPAMKSFAAYIKEQGYTDETDLETTVAATFVFHRAWQQGHASELGAERAAAKEAAEAAKAEKAKEREAKKAQKAEEKAIKEQEKEAKKAQREAEKAEKDAKAAQEAESGEAPGEPAEGAEPRKRLKVKAADPELADATAGQF
jgi:hypothetical protein